MTEWGRVAVLMGGIAAEREISLLSGMAVCQALQRSGVEAQAVDVQSVEDLRQVAQDYDRAFVALHGRWGEDGQVQAILQSLGLPFTGSAMAASALAMDKLRTKWLWRGAGLATPDFVQVSPQSPLSESLFSEVGFELSFPLIVKPSHEGSSLGMRKVDSWNELEQAVDFAQQYDQEILVERWVTGREFTVAVLNGQVLPTIELQTSHEFYDYEAKYQAQDTRYICPCDLDDALQDKINRLVLRAFEVIGASGWGRMDLMLDEQNKPWLIELNTVPGMTDHSLVPKAAKQAGMSFEELVLAILADSVTRDTPA